ERPATARDLAERFEAALLPPAESVLAPFMPAAGRVNGRSGRLPATSAASAPSQPGLPPTPSAAPPTVPVPAVAPPDPSTVVQPLEAWMPEKIAQVKLRGFIHDNGGEVLESVPGRIRVRLGTKGCTYVAPSRSSLSWLGLGRKAGQIDLELRLQRLEGVRDNSQLPIPGPPRAPP